MPNDRKKKKPTNKESELYAEMQNIMMHIQQIYTVFRDLDRRLTALSRAKIEPDMLVKFLFEGELNNEYNKRFNEFIDVKIAEDKLKQEQKKEATL